MIKTYDKKPTHDYIELIWNMCFEIYLQYGYKLSFPKNTDPQKTYQWRYLSAIAKKFIEWDFDIDMSKRFIDIAVKYSKSIGTIHKGLSALHQNNILDMCYKQVISDVDKSSQSTGSLRSIKSWLDSKINGNDPYCILSKRNTPDSFCNLTLWYQASRISPLFLSLSKTCMRVYNSIIDECELAMLPKATTLYVIRTSFLDDADNIDIIRDIFQQDLLIGKSHACRIN